MALELLVCCRVVHRVLRPGGRCVCVEMLAFPFAAFPGDLKRIIIRFESSARFFSRSDLLKCTQPT